jgi:predicted aldo/keto reductase-like oxidoreductase
MQMQYRRLGRSNLRVSAVGFGTTQFCRVPEQQALDTLKRGFALGVNVVHTAPDYQGADDLVAQAVEESGRDVLILSQGYGDAAHFEWLFESACRRFKKRRLEMFGIACVDDREYLGERVWGAGGMIEFLQRKKEEGRLGAIFCTTHGPPEYVARLVTSNCFDAIMLAYNSLGFHLLSYHPDASREFEDIPRNKTEIFPLAARHDVGLMIMKPLAGGLLCESKSFPPLASFSSAPPKLTAAEVLRAILRHPEVSCVVPGTASVEEAEENARAGHESLVVSSDRGRPMEPIIDEIKATLCSRCGLCDSLCSKHLPVSWLFRDAYITHYPSETFETADEFRYFTLHPGETAACSTCTDVTCSCPYGIDIPASLVKVHTEMRARRQEGVLPAPPDQPATGRLAEPLAAAVVTREIPRALWPRERAICRLYVQNTGRETWSAPGMRDGVPGLEVELAVGGTNTARRTIPVRHHVEPGTRTHFVFEIEAPAVARAIILRLALRASRGGWAFRRPRVELANVSIAVRTADLDAHVL